MLTPDTAPKVVDQDLVDEVRELVVLAVDRIVWHRPIAAARAVERLRDYTWALGRDDIRPAMDATDPARLAEQMKAFCDGMGWDVLTFADGPVERARLARMVQGLPCEDDCVAGCAP